MADENTNNDVNNIAEDSASDSSKVQPLSMSDIRDAKGVSLENRISELSRKTAKVAEIDAKIDQMWNFIVNSKTSNSTNHNQADNAGYEVDYHSEDGLPIEKKVERILDTKLREQTRAQLAKEHDKQFKEMIKVFPELDKESGEYDPEFYKTADSIYQKAYRDDPEGAKEAIQIAALKTGRLKKLADLSVIQDETRRSRKLAEGASESRSRRGNEDPDATPATATALAKLRIDPKLYKKAKQQLGGGQ